MNFFNQGIPLGRWFGITVVIHWTFLIYAAYNIFSDGSPGWNALFIALLFAIVLLHEFGHALSCKALGGVAIHIVLWPLGGIAFIHPPGKAWAWLVTTVCGPLVNAILWPLFYLLLHFAVPIVGDRFGYGSLAFTLAFNVCYQMIFINKFLLLFNLIPAYPMDGGRILQELIWMGFGYPRSLQVAGMVGTVAGLGFIVLGLGLQQISIPALGFSLGRKPDIFLCVIGLMCAFESFNIYRQSQQIQTWRKN